MLVKKSYGAIERRPRRRDPEDLQAEEILIEEESVQYDASIDQLLEEDLDPLPNNSEA